jgi:hypothetical protein
MRGTALPPRTVFGHPVPPTVDRFLDHRWTQTSLRAVTRWGGRLGWMAVGAGILTLVYAKVLPPLLEQTLFADCALLSGPEVDTVLAHLQLTHARAPWTADERAAWQVAQRSGPPQPTTPPYDAWRVCEAFAPLTQTSVQEGR